MLLFYGDNASDAVAVFARNSDAVTAPNNLLDKPRNFCGARKAEEPAADISSGESDLLPALEEVMACPMGRDGEHSLRLYRRPMLIGKGYVYYLQRDQENMRRLGQIRKGYATCQGDPERVFVLSTNNARHIAPYGVRYNSTTQEWQTVTLPSDTPPLYAYLNDQEFMLLDEEAPGADAAARYVAARSWAKTPGANNPEANNPEAKKQGNDLEIVAFDTLPPAENYQTTPLFWHKELNDAE